MEIIRLLKYKRCRFLIGFLSLAMVGPAPAQIPSLGIVPAGGQAIIYWPASPTNYVLQTTADLASPNWVTASNAVPVNAVVVTNASPAGYFRLSEDDTTAGMALIPAGSFTMGDYLFYDSATNDGDVYYATPTNIYVSAFYMDVNLVSYGQWQSVYNWATNHGYFFFNAGAGQAVNHPVQMVSWFDCVAWCNARSQLAGLTPAYYTDAAFTGIYTNAGGNDVYLNLTNSGYRLPTEAEWEKAARGGLSGQRFPWGNAINQELANYFGATGSYHYDLGPNGSSTNFTNGGPPYTSPVGSFPPNGYGLHDMAGNLFEWCWDLFGTPYGQPTTNNPTGPTSGSITRVMRGGAWSTTAADARCASRYLAVTPTAALVRTGFRCARGF